MAYVSLYRKYRPTSFADVVGQDHVIRTLVNAIDDDRLHHAYLFTGPRGTGKTSTARLLAKAINCESGPTSDPCGTCDQCVAITQGASVDVIELDMASHGGVDDARELRDRALFAPATARRKVYILDEIHMASTAAFNALLKLIEEPPPHVLFAMATTDPQKVLPTILSRVQRLDLRRVGADDVAGNVRRLCESEGVAIDDGAVDAVVRAGDGSLRDTQSILEQVLAFAGGQITTDAVAQVLGTTPLERVAGTVDLLGARDLAGLLALVQGLLDDGQDLRRFTLDLVQHLRDLLVLQVAPDRPDLVDATDDRRRRLQAQAGTLTRESLLRAVAVLADTVAEQRQGAPRLPLELALAQLAVPGADGDVAELADRVARLESGVPRAATSAPPSTSAPAPAASAPAPDPAEDAPSAAEPDLPERAGSESPATDPATAGSGASERVVPEPDVPEPGVPEPGVPEPHAPEPDVPEHVPDPDVADDGVPDSDVAEQAPADPEGGERTDQHDDDATAPGGADARDPLTVVKAHWDGVLELVRQESKRCHAMFEPATPTAASRGILTIKYTRRYASFHAANAKKAEFADVLLTSIERACGLRLRLDVVIDGDDDRRRPLPPSVTPDDARTPVLDPTPPDAHATSAADAAGDTDEEAQVREAEDSDASAPDADHVDQLLTAELGAELLHEQPPPGRETA